MNMYLNLAIFEDSIHLLTVLKSIVAKESNKKIIGFRCHIAVQQNLHYLLQWQWIMDMGQKVLCNERQKTYFLLAIFSHVR